jgi:hypothetical protein
MPFAVTKGTGGMQVHLKSGSRLDTAQMRRLLEILPLSQEFDSDASVGNTSDPQEGEARQEANIQEGWSVHLDDALVDLMGRYGQITSDAIFSSLPLPAEEGPPDGGDVPLRLLVRLRVERAKGIGRMDLRRGADLFCVAFMRDWSFATGLPVTVPGNRLFQTKVLRGRNEEGWTWNEVCTHQPTSQPHVVSQHSSIFCG